MGCDQGAVYLFDPILMNDGQILRYNNDTYSLMHKKKRVTHVKWFEPFAHGENSNKFIAVFEDGTIYVYFRDSKHTDETSKHVVKYKTRPFQAGFAPEEKQSSREQIISWMQ